MLNGIPPSGRWKGYYLYGHAGIKHRMSLHLTFAPDGRIDGEGIDDIAPFTITGRFDGATSQASWVKAYRGMHTVQYSGVYCQPSICGDWTLGPVTGGFWIWPISLSESEASETLVELELELAPAGAVLAACPAAHRAKARRQPRGHRCTIAKNCLAGQTARSK